MPNAPTNLNPQKTAKLILNLLCWDYRYGANLELPSSRVASYEAALELLGIPEFVHNGHRQVTYGVILCASCGKAHKLPILTYQPVYPWCISCKAEPATGYTVSPHLLDLLCTLPEEVTDAFKDLLADTYFTQLRTLGD